MRLRTNRQFPRTFSVVSTHILCVKAIEAFEDAFYA